MVTWIVVGVVALAILFLVAVMAALAGRLRPLARALGRLRVRAEQAQGLESKVTAMQERALVLQGNLEEITAGTDRLRRSRERPPGGFDGGRGTRAP